MRGVRNLKWVVIVGPTSSGKTDLSFYLSEKLNAEILSFDSRQCYKELNIGVAKPPLQYLKNVKHYFINSHSIKEEVSVNVFLDYVKEHLPKIKSDVVVTVGGTGMYLDAILFGLNQVPVPSKKIITELMTQTSSLGIDWLRIELQKEDANYFSRFPETNIRRWVKALAIKKQYGKSVLHFWNEPNIKPIINKHDTIFLYPSLQREKLYERINQKVITMLQNGLCDEAWTLKKYKHLPSLQTIGYKECFDYFSGELDSKQDLLNKIQQNTRKYAKRQLTWMRKYPKDIEYNRDSLKEELLKGIKQFLNH